MHELDPALFDPANVDPATRGFNEIAEKMLAEMPTIVDVGAAVRMLDDDDISRKR